MKMIKMKQDLLQNNFWTILDLTYSELQNEILIHGTIKIGDLKKRFDEIFKEIQTERGEHAN